MLALLIFLTLVPFSTACSCRHGNITDEERYCQRHVVARIKIIEELPAEGEASLPIVDDVDPVDVAFIEGIVAGAGALPEVAPVIGNSAGSNQRRMQQVRQGDQGYKLVFVRMYRNSTGRQLSNAVYTASFSAACGYRFQPGTEYLLFADLTSDRKLRTGLCSNNVPWNSLSSVYKATLERRRSRSGTCSKYTNSGGANSKNSPGDPAKSG